MCDSIKEFQRVYPELTKNKNERSGCVKGECLNLTHEQMCVNDSDLSESKCA